jgi:PAS domain-containing protein
MKDAVIIRRTRDASLILGIVWDSCLTIQELRQNAARAFGAPLDEIEILLATIPRPEPPRPDPAVLQLWRRDYQRAHTLRDVDDSDIERFVALHMRLRAAGVKLPAGDIGYVDGLIRWAGAA